ncbi:putative Chitin binding Peritrophin-A domain-containing protein 38 [Homarus americanus]|uniref:Putative Chitin binding Peritrophin-A domain-containing protein 38 n=1 Tax=Homarus americanus TaxID=6706 RepID=A0A8J5K600_HOMAM|nr:putative Chitin binding Peritrophin-A domain-containing protein 38 [Homarus americanus]
MKSLVVVVVAGLCVLSLRGGRTNGQELQCSKEISAQCPVNDPTPPVYIADPDNCANYCECSGGSAWSFHCDANLMYNDIKHVCDWPNNVDCGSRPTV